MRIQDMLRDLGEFLWEFIKVALLAAIIIFPIRYFLIQPFYVKGASMQPTFLDHEYLIIDELSYRLRAPTRGEVVVLRYPKDPSEFFIKRIVGLPGERITVKDGQVIVSNNDYPQGAVLKEGAYLAPEVTTVGDRLTQLAPDEYFVMGDNRNESFDSRNFGPVPRADIIGRVWLRLWPFSLWPWPPNFSRITVFHAPSYVPGGSPDKSTSLLHMPVHIPSHVFVG